MFGFYMLILWIVIACALGIKGTMYDHDSKSKAIKNGRDFYVDSNHHTREVDGDARYYIHTDLNGDVWRIYPNHDKPDVNITSMRRYDAHLNHKRQVEEFEDGNLKIAEDEGWRFYRIKKNNILLKGKTQRYIDATSSIKGYDTDGPDIYIDRENGHKCVFINRSCVYCIYDLDDDRLYHWYFKTIYDMKSKRYEPMPDRVWNILDEDFFFSTLAGIRSSKESYLKLYSARNMSSDVIYKYGEQAEYHFTDADIAKHFGERR